MWTSSDSYYPLRIKAHRLAMHQYGAIRLQKAHSLWTIGPL